MSPSAAAPSVLPAEAEDGDRGHVKGWVDPRCLLALRAQFTDRETEAATRTGNPCPSTQSGTAAVASHRGLHSSEKLSLGQGRVERERLQQRMTRPRLEGPGWGVGGGEGWVTRKRKLLCPSLAGRCRSLCWGDPLLP